MCGIAGVVKFDPREQVSELCLSRMRDVLRHRGPDEEGLLIDGPVGLAHQRLAIVDARAGRQPMSNEDGSIWIVFNGEIYNHADLRPGLERRGHQYRTRCDTETIIHLYEEEGDACVKHLHGMFAFAIWDRPRQRLLLARDRLGIKPLYYTWTDSELLFASEIKALIASESIRPTVNAAALPEFLATRFISGEQTFFGQVRKVLPGHTASWSIADGFDSHRYWSLPTPTAVDTTLGRQAKEVRVRLESAVQSHLMSDVPLGVFLSGGLDSSALAAMVAKKVDQPILTFAVGFADREANELEYARMVAKAIGSQHREIVVSAAEYFESLPHLLWHEDEPIAFTSSIPLYFVARLASDHVKVVLTGEGADELFLGYNKYRATYWNDRLGRPYWNAIPSPLRRRIRQLASALPSSARRFTDRSFIALEPGMRDLFLENFAVFSTRLQQQLLDRSELRNADPYATTQSCYDGTTGELLNRLSHLDLQTYLHELLMKQDQMSMAASIESRVPFLDDHVIEYVAALPASFKLRGLQTKAVLRTAVHDLLPPAILTRRKMGFPVPVGRWLRGEFWPLVEEFVLGARTESRALFNRETLRRLAFEHRSGRRQHGDRLWLLINLEIWLRIFFDGEHPSDVMRAVPGRRPETFYANPLGQNGRSLASQHWRPRPQPADRVGALAPAPSHAGYHSRIG